MQRHSVGVLPAVMALGAGLLAGGCGERERTGPPPASDGRPALAIAAASDLRYALDELITVFRASHPGIGVSASYAASGSLYAQLLNGAPFDLYLSADMMYARQLAERDVALPGSLFGYATGRLALWAPASSTLDVERLGLQALTDPSVRRIAIANPRHAPYGRAAEAALRSAGVYGAVRERLVLGEHVSQAFQFVESGAAQAGIVALSMAAAQPAAPGRYWVVPAGAHPPIQHGGAIMRRSARPDAARAFRALLLGPEGRAALDRHGFTVSGP